MRGLSLLVVVSSLAACDNGTPEGTFTVTEVHLRADGTQDVTVQTLTRSEWIAQNEIIEGVRSGKLGPEAYLAHQIACSGSPGTETRLYDNDLLTCQSGCNQICFVRDGGPNANVYLGDYCVDQYCNWSWWSRVRSWWTGDYGFNLWAPYAGPGGTPCVEYASNQRRYQNAGTCAQNASYLYFY